jgi:hypothetical protein
VLAMVGEQMGGTPWLSSASCIQMRQGHPSHFCLRGVFDRESPCRKAGGSAQGAGGAGEDPCARHPLPAEVSMDLTVPEPAPRPQVIAPEASRSMTPTHRRATMGPDTVFNQAHVRTRRAGLHTWPPAHGTPFGAQPGGVSYCVLDAMAQAKRRHGLASIAAPA